MKKIALAGVLLLVVSCSNDSAPPVQGSEEPFVGEWSCLEEGGLDFPDSTVTFIPTKPRISITSPSHGHIVVASDAKGSCPLQFSIVESTAQVVSGQSCQEADGSTFNYSTGSANVAGESLRLVVHFEVSEAADGSVGMNGTGDITDECSRVGAPGSQNLDGGGG